MRRFLASGQAWKALIGISGIKISLRDEISGCLLKDNSIFLLKKSSLFVFLRTFNREVSQKKHPIQNN